MRIAAGRSGGYKLRIKAGEQGGRQLCTVIVENTYEGGQRAGGIDIVKRDGLRRGTFSYSDIHLQFIRDTP